MDKQVIDNIPENNASVNLDLEPIITLDDKFSPSGLCEYVLDTSIHHKVELNRREMSLIIIFLSLGFYLIHLAALLKLWVAMSNTYLCIPYPKIYRALF
jgi:hypothetical protein